MEKYHIKLTESESAILTKIDLSESHRNHDEGHAAYKINAQPILVLLQSLRDSSTRFPKKGCTTGVTHVTIRVGSKHRAKAYSKGMVAKAPISTLIRILSVIFAVFSLALSFLTISLRRLRRMSFKAGELDWTLLEVPGADTLPAVPW